MSHSPTQLFALTTIALLLSAIVLALSSAASGQFNPVNASSTIPLSDQEYANGTLVSNNAPFKVWYMWVNVSNTQVLYYAAYTTPDYPFPVPIANIVGQHFILEDGTQIFIASAYLSWRFTVT